MELSYINKGLLVRRSTQHLWDSHWTQIFHRGRSTAGRKSHLHVALIGTYLVFGCRLGLWYSATTRHECRRLNPQRLQSMASNRKDQSAFSIHWHFHIFWNTRRRIHNFGWWNGISDFLSRSSIFIYIWPWDRGVGRQFRQSNSRDRHSPPGRGNWSRGCCHRFWTAPSGRRIGHAHRRRWRQEPVHWQHSLRPEIFI